MDLSVAFEEALARVLATVEHQRVPASHPKANAEAGKDTESGADMTEQTRKNQGVAPTRTADLALVPPKNDERLVELANWHRDEALRRKWVFRSDHDVLRWFGMPNSVSAGGGTERWKYVVGETATHFTFHRGRIVTVYVPAR